eukprot:6156735-Amphidinium_carterae.1
MIQKLCVQPLRLAHMPLREHSNTEYFDMVAELAIELARILVTHASQLFTTIVLLLHRAIWICGTISAYMEGVTGSDSDSESDDVVAM